MYFLLTLLAVLPGAAPSKDASKEQDATTAARAIDFTYTPQIGDVLWLDAGNDDDGEPFLINCATSIPHFITYAQIGHLEREAREAAFDKMEAAKMLRLLDVRTRVLVMDMSPIETGRTPSPTGRGVVRWSMPVAHVKVLDGKFKGQDFYVDVRDVKCYVEQADQPSVATSTVAKKTKKKKKFESSTTKPAAPSAKPIAGATSRAASLLKMGQNLEKAEKAPGAIEFYQKVVKQFPDTPEAKVAKDRLSVLQKK